MGIAFGSVASNCFGEQAEIPVQESAFCYVEQGDISKDGSPFNSTEQ